MILNGSKGCFAVYYKDLLLSSIPVYKDHKIIWEKYLQRTNKIIIQNLKKGGTIKDVINFCLTAVNVFHHRKIKNLRITKSDHEKLCSYIIILIRLKKLDYDDCILECGRKKPKKEI